MEMEKSYYVVTFKPAYEELLRSRADSEALIETDEAAPERVVVAITQGGFGQDVVDDERQVKERFLEYLFHSSGIDLPRAVESFDRYFELDSVDELIDLDEEI
ncbi:MAG TPA: hypothetical protein VNN73_20315 [Blastocatellia bacterium]|nr:hypothetical protein [Blastocatellia bacterium]